MGKYQLDSRSTSYSCRPIDLTQQLNGECISDDSLPNRKVYACVWVYSRYVCVFVCRYRLNIHIIATCSALFNAMCLRSRNHRSHVIHMHKLHDNWWRKCSFYPPIYQTNGCVTVVASVRLHRCLLRKRFRTKYGPKTYGLIGAPRSLYCLRLTLSVCTGTSCCS